MTWVFNISTPNFKTLLNIVLIAIGVALTSVGEIKFVWIGFFYQMSGIFAESIRLVMTQILLSEDGQGMNALVALYYYAPICTVINFFIAVAMERSELRMVDVWRVGVGTFVLNAMVVFLLNVASVFLVSGPR